MPPLAPVPFHPAAAGRGLIDSRAGLLGANDAPLDAAQLGPRGDLWTVETETVAETPPTVTSEDYAHEDYLGAYNSDPRAATNADVTQRKGPSPQARKTH